MRSLIVFTLLFFTLQHAAAAEQTKRQDDNGAADVPAFSYESNKFLLRIDKETLDFVNEKLGERPPKFLNKRRNVELVDRQAPDVIDRERVAMFTDLFGRLVQENALVERLAQEVAAVPDAFNPGWNQLENIPRFEDVDIQQAFVEVIPVGVIYIRQRAPPFRRPVFEPVGIAISILGMIAAYSTGSLLSALISLNTNGVMENSCPNPQFTACGQPFCKGAGTQCSGDSFLKSCQCEMGDCPASDKMQLFCDEKDCGGQDLATGRCRGREGDGKNKNCYCGTFEVSTYPFMQSSIDAIRGLVELGEWKPPTSGLTCTKANIKDIQSNPETWKFVDQQTLDSHIDPFCDELDHLDDAADGSFERTYETNNLNEVKLRAEWQGGTTMSRDECKKYVGSISFNCDYSNLPIDSNPNQYNWKWGGVQARPIDNKIKFSITPLRNRARLEILPSDSNWRGTHWWDITMQNPDSSKLPKGKNGRDWDFVTLHQCLHDLRRHDWNGGQPYNCAGFVDFSGSAWASYSQSGWTNCFDNTWEIVSWKILNEGAVALYGNHKTGCCSKCWMGINQYVMPE